MELCASRLLVLIDKLEHRTQLQMLVLSSKLAICYNILHRRARIAAHDPALAKRVTFEYEKLHASIFQLSSRGIAL